MMPAQARAHIYRPDRQPGHCRWCDRKIEAGRGRRLWCGQECVMAYKNAVGWQHHRWAVERRDRGICALCGCDTAKIKRIIRLGRVGGRYGLDWSEWGSAVRRLLGMSPDCSHRGWELDHIVPRSEGGGNEITNLRTLCYECHKQVTKRQAGERARRRRQDRT